MGHDSENTIPKTPQKKIEEFLTTIGATKSEPGYYYFYKDEDYRYYQGVGIYILNKERDNTKICTRTTIFCSEWDLKMQNRIIRLVKERFGGTFSTDRGRGRYFSLNGENREKDEAGCFLAFESFHQSVGAMRSYLRNFRSKVSPGIPSNKFSIEIMGRHHPLAVPAAMALPYLISITEKYFRDTFIALIRYRGNESFFRKQQIHKAHNYDLAMGRTTAVEALAQSISFQNMRSISESFKDIDMRFDLAKVLKTRYKKSTKSLYKHLEELFQHRHQIIHRASLESGYLINNVDADVKKIELGVKKVYSHLIKVLGWRKYP